MKKMLLSLGVVTALALTVAPAFADDLNQPMCKVEVCNKIERLSLDIFAHIKDSMGETCSTVIIPKSEAQEGKVLSSDSRWYQGSSINPTKKSVTRINRILQCQKD